MAFLLPPTSGAVPRTAYLLPATTSFPFFSAARGKPMQRIDAATVVKARVGIKLMTGLGLTYALANAAGGKSDLNLFSSGFGNIDAGPPSPMNSAASVAAAELGVGTANYAGKNVQFNPTASIA